MSCTGPMECHMDLLKILINQYSLVTRLGYGFDLVTRLHGIVIKHQQQLYCIGSLGLQPPVVTTELSLFLSVHNSMQV